MTTPPFVSIIIPCYNEEKYIAQCLDSIMAGDYPQDCMEILVVDGRSTDRTRDVLVEYSKRHLVVRTVDNPHRLKPHALNIGIMKAKGEILIRMDAHALYDKSYVSRCIRYLVEYEADNVGGIRKTLPTGSSVLARSIAASISSPFGAGNATYRTGAKGFKWVDTVFGGCYRREIFRKIGLFNELLVRGQDREFNVRLQKAGGKILFAPDIVCHYYARGSLRAYLPWIYSGGLTPFYVTRLIGQRIYAWRNFIPMVFVLSLCVLLMLSLLHSIFMWIFTTELGLYLCFSIFSAIPIAKREKGLGFLLSMPIVFFMTHVVYGVGSIIGLIKPLKRTAEWTQV